MAKKFATLSIRKISGGKDPVRLVEEFISRQGFDPEKAQQQKSADSMRWMLNLGTDEDLEILAEGLKIPSETTIYMGVNVMTVPVRGANDLLIAALQIADGLIGIKVSLVGHYLVLSASMGASGLSVEELDYNYKLITAQQAWFKEALTEEMGWESLPEE